MVPIQASVGSGGRNRPVDVVWVQHLLNLNGAASVAGPLEVTGEIGDADAAIIRHFQAQRVGLSQPDGRVDPDGKTLRVLSAVKVFDDLGEELRSALGPSGASHLLGPGDARRFIQLYERQFEDLAPAARVGLARLLDLIDADPDVPDVRHRAYMLATVKHECAGRWLPIEEYKKGGKREYARPVSVTDDAGNVFTQSYYGRGYVQLTWQDNYRKLGHELGMGDRLMLDPKLALDPETSYRILSHGMRTGSFTSKKLSDFIEGSRCDYANARRIVNGTDRHLEIAGHAMRLELLLRLCARHRLQ